MTRTKQTGNQIKQSTLTCAVLAKQTINATLREGQTKVLQYGLTFAVFKRYITYVYHILLV